VIKPVSSKVYLKMCCERTVSNEEAGPQEADEVVRGATKPLQPEPAKPQHADAPPTLLELQEAVGRLDLRRRKNGRRRELI